MRFEVSTQRLIASDYLGEVGSILLVGKKFYAFVFEDWLFIGKGTGFLIRRCQVPSGNLAGFNVRLVKCVNAEDGTCNCGCDLPSVKLLTEVVVIAHCDTDNRMAGFFECGDLCVLLRVSRRLESQVGEDAILAVDLRPANRFTVHW